MSNIAENTIEKRFQIYMINRLLLSAIALIALAIFDNTNSYAISYNKELQSNLEQNGPDSLEIIRLENAVKTNPDFKNLNDLSVAYINAGNPEKSIDHLKKAIALEPKNAVAYNNLGSAYNMMHRYKDGIKYCTDAVELDGTFELAKNNLNWAKGVEKEILLSIENMEAMQTDKREPNYFIALGMLYLHLQDYNKCIQIWNKSLSSNPKDTEALNNIAIAYLEQQNYDEAIKYLNKAVEIDPEYQLAKNNLSYTLSEQDKFIKSQKK